MVEGDEESTAIGAHWHSWPSTQWHSGRGQCTATSSQPPVAAPQVSQRLPTGGRRPVEILLGRRDLLDCQNGSWWSVLRQFAGLLRQGLRELLCSRSRSRARSCNRTGIHSEQLA
jgi:hypothetical protein